MYKVSVAVMVVVSFAMLVPSAVAQGQRAGAGIVVMSPLGDVDDGAGGYVSYMFDISDMLATYVGFSHVSGDYELSVSTPSDVDGGEPTVEQHEGSYSATQAEAAFLVQWAMDVITPYAGVGGGYSWISFDDMNVGDKLSLFYTVGLLYPVRDRLRLEAGARLSYLRPRSYRPQRETVDMDGWWFRLGATWEF